MSSLFDLSGKTALVTGCNKGIGKAMALGLAEAGADIIGVSGSLELSGSDIEKRCRPLEENSKRTRPIYLTANLCMHSFTNCRQKIL
jgi:2-deoxy-D-gluconate 3-dehydrogenase